MGSGLSAHQIRGAGQREARVRLPRRPGTAVQGAGQGTASSPAGEEECTRWGVRSPGADTLYLVRGSEAPVKLCTAGVWHRVQYTVSAA